MDDLTIQSGITGTLLEYLISGAVSLAAIISILAVTFWLTKRTLVFRIFLFIVPAMGIICFLGAVIGLNHLAPIPYVLSVLGAAAVGLVSLSFISKSVVKTLRSQADGMFSSAAQLSATAQESAGTAQEQSSAVSQVTGTIEEIHQMGKVTSSGAQEVMSITTQAVNQGKAGLEKIDTAVKILDEVAQVSDVVDMVNDLAEQSNLLAVNAGIEAAKAGDYGRGFSVVAAEVRTLAEQSKHATDQIRKAIGKTQDGRRVVLEVKELIENLSGVLRESADKSREISGAVVQQSAGIRQISEAMQNVAKGGADTAAGATQVEEAVENLKSIAGSITEYVSGAKSDNQ